MPTARILILASYNENKQTFAVVVKKKWKLNRDSCKLANEENLVVSGFPQIIYLSRLLITETTNLWPIYSNIGEFLKKKHLVIVWLGKSR